jgi:hypothetical protein
LSVIGEVGAQLGERGMIAAANFRAQHLVDEGGADAEQFGTSAMVCSGLKAAVSTRCRKSKE